MERTQQAPKESNADRMKRVPKVLIAYAKDIRGGNAVSLDSGAAECIVFSAHTIEALLHINSCLTPGKKSSADNSDIHQRAVKWLQEPLPDNGAPVDVDIAEASAIISDLLNLSVSRLENIKSMSSFLDDIATALGVAKPETPVEGIGACWKVIDAIHTLTQKAAANVWPNLVAPPKYENPTPGWHDPKLPDIQLIWKLAREVGYAVGVHGSLKRDFDLIAAPWTEDAVNNAALVKHLCAGLNAQIVGGPEYKPLGRVAVSLQIHGYYKTIDLSIEPKVQVLDDSNLWCVHIQGPDDIIAMVSKEAADLEAAKINKSVGRMWQEGDPEINAIATIWPGSAESHASELKEISSDSKAKALDDLGDMLQGKLSGCQHEDGSGWCNNAAVAKTCPDANHQDNGSIGCGRSL